MLFESVLGAKMSFSFRFDDDRWDRGNHTLWDYMFNDRRRVRRR